MPVAAALNTTPSVAWHAWTCPKGRRTGVLEITTRSKRIWSVPSLWGCPVGCTFCISSTQAYDGRIDAPDLCSLLDRVRQSSTSALPVELSFTGEGEAVLNVDNILALVDHVRTWREIDAARLCVSGLRMERAWDFIHLPWPTRLQCSLHSAVQSTRNRLIPNSPPLDVLRAQLVELTPAFACVDLNVVLQSGVNDSDAHLRALLTFTASTPWRVVFNPHMQEGTVGEHPALPAWQNAVRTQGTPCEVYRTIGKRIVDNGLYQTLTFVRGADADVKAS